MQRSIRDTPLSTFYQRMASRGSSMTMTLSLDKSDPCPHSPSPASVSQSRPSSIFESTKTASRVPIPSTKKATVIDVKKGRARTSHVPKLVPSFGSRHLASPEPSKVLDSGKIRQQLDRMPTNANRQRIKIHSPWETESNVTTCSCIATPP